MESGAAKLKQWWSNKYDLPPSHELFQNQSVAELTQEMYEDLYTRKMELEAILDSDEPKGDRAQTLEQYGSLCKALGEQKVVQDELAEQWEKDLAEGRMPDLEAKTT